MNFNRLLGGPRRGLIHLLLAAGALAAGMGLASATERGPTRVAAAAQVHGTQGRVIVKYRGDSSFVQAQALAVRQQVGAQHASRLAARTGLALTDGHAMSERMQVVLGSGMSSAALAAQLAQDSNVEWAVPDRRQHAAMVPNDPYFASGQTGTMPPAGQWFLRAYDATLVAATNVQGAWDTTSGSGVVVAVIDTGVRPEHPDLSGHFLQGANMISLNTASEGAAGLCISGNGSCRTNNPTDPTDPGDWVSQSDVTSYPNLFDSSCIEDSTWHGTQVSGIIGASTNNSLGVAGVAYGASILPVRVMGKCGGFESDIIDGMRWAAGLHVSGMTDNANPARVLNLSLGGSGTCDAAYLSAVSEIVTSKQAVIVVAAGNEGTAVDAPGNCSGVVAVAGLRHAGDKVGYSSLGPEVAISAPAGNCVNSSGACLYPIVTTLNAGTTTAGSSTYSDAYTTSLGTSFATPQVAGTAALMLSVNSSLTSAQVTSLLKSSARAFPTSGGSAGTATCQAPTSTAQDECYCTTSTCGAGMLNAAAAVAAAGSGSSDTVTAAISASATSVSAGTSVTLNGGGSTSSGSTISSYAWSITSGSGLATLSTGSGSTTTLNTSAAGTVVVQLTVTDALGVSNSTTQSIVVTASTSDTVTAAIKASAASVIAGKSVTLDGSASTSSGSTISSYAWSITSGSGLATLSSGSGSTTTLTTSAAGTVVVQLTVTDALGKSNSTTQSISIAQDVVTAAISASATSVSAGTAVKLDGSGSTSTGSSVSSYDWSITSGSGLASLSSGAGSSVTLTTSGAGTVTVQLTVTDELGVSSSTTRSITVTETDSGGGGGGAWSPAWALGLLLAGLLLPARRHQRAR